MDHLIRDLLGFTGTRLGARMEVTPHPMDPLQFCAEELDEMRAPTCAARSFPPVTRISIGGGTTGAFGS